MPSTEALGFNGLDATSGRPLVPALTSRELSALARGETLEKSALTELTWRRSQRDTLGTVGGVDATKLEQAGWGVVFGADADASVREALTGLLNHRREQAGSRYREFWADDGYRPGETKTAFLVRHGAAPGPVVPDRMPYYLLLVAPPSRMPFQFQYQLDVQHAVGRIWFDTPAEFEAYAASVVEAERKAARPRTATFVGVRNPDDRATELGATELVAPLAQSLADRCPTWEVRTLLASDTTKSRLLPVFGGSETPGLLFTASHGLGWPSGHQLQRRHQGALVCQDWPGSRAHQGAIPADYYISSDDVADDATLLGLISFHFACYGAGTPLQDDFGHRFTGQRATLAPESFIAALPQRMLGHQGGGAVAVVGHVDLAWEYSFRTSDQRQLGAYETLLTGLAAGQPIGYAMEAFNEYYAELATDLTEAVEAARWAADDAIDHDGLAALWTRQNDARNFAIIGDPAVRVSVPE